jgi:hypothetical protein
MYSFFESFKVNRLEGSLCSGMCLHYRLFKSLKSVHGQFGFKSLNILCKSLNITRVLFIDSCNNYFMDIMNCHYGLKYITFEWIAQ